MVTDLEKRIKLLRQQVHGKQSLAIRHQLSDKSKTESTNSLDVVYLRKDLLKIFVMATAALGLMTILKFNFF